MSDIEIIPGGPSLPLPIIEALEAERLVFFCGAGISMGTGLPDFRNLTLDAIGELSGLDEDRLPTGLALRDTFSTMQYDKALEILERNTAGKRLRDLVAKRLTAPPTKNPDLPLHKAILALAKRRDAPNGSPRGYRLVTTNYDDRFELAGLEHRWIEAAPHLSRPRGDRERAGYATYLHGRIETETTKRDPACHELVLTSADFGNAYLRDGFATRFVLELFREFTVLFIGYGINDPVMRYLVDIIDTERSDLGKGQFKTPYAIVSFASGQKGTVEALWDDVKRVTPILYDNADGHQRLTELLTGWARLHTGGADGRFTRLMEIIRRPYGGKADDGRLRTAAWALAEKNSRTAERLVDLGTDTEDADISWFGSLLDAEIVDPEDDRYPRKRRKLHEIERVTRHLCRWAMRHLDKQTDKEGLIDWAIANQRLLLSSLREPFFQELIRRLYEQSELPPVAEPHRTFWQALIEIAVRHNTTREWRRLFRPSKAERHAPGSLMSLIELPELEIAWPTKPWRLNTRLPEEKPRLRSLGQFQLSGLGPHGFKPFKRVFADPADQESARSDLAPHLDDLTSLLLEVCRLGHLIEAPFAMGNSDFERPSIQPHEGNDLDFHDLSWLIEAIIRSFEVAAVEEIDDAIAVALRWRLLWRRHRHALLGRLYLHAAAVLPEHLSADSVADDLLDQPDILWSGEYRAEVLPVLRLRIAEASPERQQALIHRLLEPPPSALFLEDSDELIERCRGQRLAWLQRGGVVLEGQALGLARSYLANNPPTTDPRPNEVSWIRHSVRVGAIGFGPSYVGQSLAAILEDLQAEHDPSGAWDRSNRVADWLREQPQRVVEALAAFVAEPSLPKGAVDGAFWALGSLKPGQLCAEKLAAAIDLVLRHEDRLIGANPTAVAGWLQNIASWPAERIDEERFFRLWDCTLTHAPAEQEPTDANADLNTAINALGGKLAEALRDRFWLTKPRVGQGLPVQFSSRLEQLVRSETLVNLHARLVCMQVLDGLFAIDPAWTQEHLLARLQWRGEFADQAAWHWRAHLCYGRTSLDLAEAYRTAFLQSLGEFADSDFNTFRSACGRFAVLGAIHSFFSRDETRPAFAAMGPKGAATVVETLRHRLKESSTAGNMWREMIGPWFERHWPRAAELASDHQVAQAIAELVIETDDAFIEALVWAERSDLIRPLPSRYSIIWRLTDNSSEAERRWSLSDRFPGELCRFLVQILSGEPLPPHERKRLGQIADAIAKSPHCNAESAPCLAQLRAL